MTTKLIDRVPRFLSLLGLLGLVGLAGIFYPQLSRLTSLSFLRYLCYFRFLRWFMKPQPAMTGAGILCRCSVPWFGSFSRHCFPGC